MSIISRFFEEKYFGGLGMFMDRVVEIPNHEEEEEEEEMPVSTTLAHVMSNPCQVPDSIWSSSDSVPTDSCKWDDAISDVELQTILHNDDSDGLVYYLSFSESKFSNTQILDWALYRKAYKCISVLLCLKVDLSSRLNDVDGVPLHAAAESLNPHLVETFIRHGAKTSTLSFSGYKIFALEEALESFCWNLEDQWNSEQSIFKLIIILCLPRMKDSLETIRLLAQSTKEASDVIYSSAMGGHLIALAIFLMVAREKILGYKIPVLGYDGSGIDGKTKKHLDSETIRSVVVKNKTLKMICQDRQPVEMFRMYKHLKKSAISLFIVFERAGDAIERYLKLQQPNVPEEQVIQEVALLLVETGFNVKPEHTDLSDINRCVIVETDKLVEKESGQQIRMECGIYEYSQMHIFFGAANDGWVQTCKKLPALHFVPAENSQVSKYKMVMKRFLVSFSKQPWSKIEKENLAKGLKQQYQEMLLLNSMNFENDTESSMNPDLMSAIISNDLEVTPEKIRSFLPLVNWDRLASMYLTGRSGAECESRWLNCEDPLINHSPWTVLEDKKLLFIVQERGIYNWIDIAIMLGTQRTPFQCLSRYQRSLNPHILNKDWTEDEDARLCSAVEIFGDNNWQLVASNLEGRTGPQCSNRWRKTLHPDRRKVGRWSVDEDKRLKVAVMLFGAKNWNKIAQFAPGRTQVQCRERWLNCLDPSLKLDAWTKEEDDKLEAAINQHGYSWSRVAACVPQRTDNQCMRRWKHLFPEEVLLLREARRIKKTVLVSNFVDRESERPSIGPSDFSSLVNLPISECGNSRSGKKRGTREKNQREGSCDKKLKKSRAKSRRASKEHFKESGSLSSAETPFADLSLVPAEPGVNRLSTNTAGNGSTKRTRKRVTREGPQSKIQRTVSRDNNLQIRQSKKSTAKAKARVKETIVTDSKVDVCDDEDVPLINWLETLALEARSKRLSNKSSRRPGGINQRETYRDDIVSIRTEKPQAIRKRFSKESIKNDAIGCGNNMLSKDKNNKPRYLVSNQSDISDQSAEGNNIVQLGHTMVDVSDASVPVFKTTKY